MGWVLERESKSGETRYTAMYRDIAGRKRSAGTFTTETKAIAKWGEAEGNQTARRVGDPRRGRQSLRKYAEAWFRDHVIEETTRESYRSSLDRHILPGLGHLPLREFLPSDIRAWVVTLVSEGIGAPTIRKSKAILDSIFTTALNDQIISIHPGKGVKTPPVAKKPKRIVTAEEYQRIHDALPDEMMKLLVEVDIESGLRWGELTELRPKDLDPATGLLTVARAVVQLKAKGIDDNRRFVVKPYPKDKEWRQIGLAQHVVHKLVAFIEARGLGPDDLLFSMPDSTGPSRRRRPAVLPDPATLGLTKPNDKGRRYPHGTSTAYGAGKCRCQHCGDAVAAYRARRRASGKDDPRSPRRISTDGHIPNDWFRTRVWNPAVKRAGLNGHVTPHGLRHAHASWLLAGGADLQVVKERLGHGSITTTEGYLHTLPNAHETALTALDAIRGQQKSEDDGDPQPVKRKKKPRKRKKPDVKRAALEAELAEMRGVVTEMSTNVTKLLSGMEHAG